VGKALGEMDGGIAEQLRSLMQVQDVTSFRALAQRAGVSEGQILQLRRGKIAQMRLEILQRLAISLGIDLAALLSLGGIPLGHPASTRSAATGSGHKDPPADNAPADNASHSENTALQQEYERLEQRLAQQETDLLQRFQQDSLYALEAWMKNWPRVVHAVQTDKPDLAAAKVLPLVKPLEQLLQSWGVEAIGCIGKPLPYDPQVHQLVQGNAEPGHDVLVIRPGYRQGQRLLHRAEVKP
jgi:transcriptional regulator with XRE-family HTH domain